MNEQELRGEPHGSLAHGGSLVHRIGAPRPMPGKEASVVVTFSEAGTELWEPQLAPLASEPPRHSKVVHGAPPR